MNEGAVGWVTEAADKSVKLSKNLKDYPDFRRLLGDKVSWKELSEFFVKVAN